MARVIALAGIFFNVPFNKDKVNLFNRGRIITGCLNNKNLIVFRKVYNYSVD